MMSVVKRWMYGISIVIILNYIIQRFIGGLNVVVKLWIFDFSNIIKAIIITFFNLISWVLIKFSVGGGITT